jgi:hypothetical protein
MYKQSSATARRSALAASLLLLFALPLLAQSGPTTVRRNVHHDVSPPLSEMIRHAPPPSLTRRAVEPMRRIPLPPGLEQLQEDPVLQTATVAPPTPPVLQSFEGLGNGQYGFSVTGAPPDTNGTVGATQYVQWVNTSFAIFNKSNGALISGPTAGNTIWSGFGGGCQTNNDGDPIVTYDKLANRWVFSQFSVSTTPYLQCIAVSTTSDATGTYNRYSFQYSNFDDYPKMSVWPDAYYVTFNMFAGGTTFVGADACAYDRAAMLAGTTATQICFQQGTSVGGLLPADLDGTTAPPSGSPNYLMYFGTNNLNLFKFHVDFTTPANSTFTGPTVINVAAFSPLCAGGTCVPQPSVTQQLDSLADRLMYRLAYRNFGSHESLVVNHSVVAGSGGGVRWYEIQNPAGTPVVAQQSTFAPDSNYRWMGSVAMDQAGDLALGYSVSAASSVFPSIRFAGRVPTDPASTLEAEVNIVSGAGSQNGNLSRWGDYSAMQVDPVDDCTFWFTEEYMKTTGSFNWNTRIASFKFPSCGSTATPDYSIAASPSSLTITQGSSGTSTITITSLNGFNSATTLSASGLPSGVTAAFSTNPVTPPANGSASSTLTLTASATATTGNATVTVSGTAGSLTHSTTIALTVNSSTGSQTAVFDSTLKAPKCVNVGSGCDSGPSLLLGRDTMSGGAEPNQPNTINNSCADGTSGTFHSDESNDRIVVATTDGSALAPGKTVKVSATVWAYSSNTSDALDLYYTANANSPSWVLIATIVPPAAGAQTLSATYTLPSGSLQAVRANFRYLGSASSCSTGAYDDHDDLIFAVGAGTPGFTVAASPSAISVTRGSTATSTITVTSLNGFNSATTLSASALPSGVTTTFSANPITPPANGSATSTLTFAASSTATTGTTNVTVTGTSGSLVQTTPISLTVNASSTQLIQNGGFETGTLANWTAGGVYLPFTTTVQKHGGTYSAQLGASSGSEPNGDSSLYQTIAIPSTATKATLTFYYWPSTTDTITYDWQEAQVQNTSGTTLAQIMKVASNTQTWTLVTYDLTSYKGQTIRVYFNDHQDGFGDLTYMYLDDVSVTVQ